jgi:glycosyltransferase involved in cell wall biosynthesis
MPVYNRERYVGAAIESILGQTFPDFEFIIVDDGSTDETVHVIESFDDPRIRLVSLDTNRGISHALNMGIGVAKGKFIARADSDDISLPRRLERQLEYMDSHPDIGICGASIGWVDANGHPLPKPFDEWHAITDPEQAKIRLLYGVPFAHPTFFVRRWIYQAIPYRSHWDLAEDYGFLVEASRLTSLGGLKEKLMLVRQHPERSSRLQIARQNEIAMQISMAMLMQLGVTLDQNDRENWRLFFRPPPWPLSTEELRAVDELGARILTANMKSKKLDAGLLQSFFSKQWWQLCRRACHLGSPVAALYSNSKLKWKGPMSGFYGIRMATLCRGIGREVSLARWLAKRMMHR